MAVVCSGWLTEDPAELEQKFGCQWRTTNFRAGDVLVFTNRTVHMSTKVTSIRPSNLVTCFS